MTYSARAASGLIGLFFVACANPPPVSDAATGADAQLERDSGVIDAQVEADARMEADAGGARVAVEVTSDGAPLPDALVVFHDAEGLPLATALTDSTGRAEHALTEGSVMVTVAAGAPRRAVTYPDVRVGETLHVQLTAETPPVLVPVTAAFATPPPGTVTVVVRSSSWCGEESTTTLDTPVTLDVCADDPAFDVLALALDAGGALIGSASSLDRPSGTTAVTLGTWRTDFARVPFSFTGAAASALDYSLWGASGARQSLLAQTDSESTTLSVPLGIGDGYRELLVLPDARLSRRVTTLPTSIAIDAAIDFLPAITIVVADGITDPTRPELVWSYARPSDADVVTVENGAWTVYLPPTATSLTWPALPDVLADLRPAAASAVSIRLSERSWIDGWDAVRLATSPLAPTDGTWTSRSRIGRARLSAPDTDGDGVPDVEDACPTSPNDDVGDPCNHDEDGDGIPDTSDPCPLTSAPSC